MCRILLTAIAVVSLAAADWPQALGPHRNGIVVDEALVPPVGEEMPRVLWQANAGHGVSPVVVVRGRVYVYGVFKAGSQPTDLANPATTPLSTEVRQIAAGPHAMVRSGDVPGTPEWAKQDQHGLYRGDGYVQCLDAVSGEQLWATRLTDWGIVLWGNWLAAERSSPAWSDDRLFIHTINGRLFALEAGTGRVLWEINLFDHQMLRWDEKNGNACSPLVCGDTVIVSFLAGADTERTSYQQMCLTAVAGFDVATGSEKWVTKIPCEAFRSMSSDIGYAEIDNQATVLVPGGMGTAGINPVDGTIRWVVMPPWMEGFRIWAQYPGRMPVAWQNHVVDCTTIAHDDKPSQTWGIRIANGKPALLWSTHDLVPASAETD
jgi:outer membrane protein assembly factor BamB